MTDTIVELENVQAAYARDGFVLDVPQLRIGRAERVACIGPSGTGKTTLVRVMAGLHPARRGRVRVLDVELGPERAADPSSAKAGSTSGLTKRPDEAARRRFRLERLGLVFQDLALVDYLSARDNIRLATYLDHGLRRELGRRAASQRASELGRSLGLDAQLARKPARLSQGERQRVAIARALFTRPELLICDEPTGHLDPQTAADTLQLFFGALRECGSSVFFVTHDHSLLERFDRVVDTGALGASSPGPSPPGLFEQERS